MSDSYAKQLIKSRREAEAKREREAKLYLDKLHDEQLKRRDEKRPSTKARKIALVTNVALKEDDSLEEDIPFALALEKLKSAKSINQIETPGTIRKIPELNLKFDPTAKTSIRDKQLKSIKKGGRRIRKRTKRTAKRKSKRRTKHHKT